MELAVYQYIRESDRAADELPMKALWCEGSPEPGETVSMGLGEHWEVVKVYTYRPIAIGQPVRAVHMIQIGREDLLVPPEDQWIACQMHQSTPEQTFSLLVEDVGGEILEMSFNFTEDTPIIDTRLCHYELVGEGTRMRAVPRNWWVDHFDTYLSSAPTPYRSVYLGYCTTALDRIRTEA
jgi:hypothetical protein